MHAVILLQSLSSDSRITPGFNSHHFTITWVELTWLHFTIYKRVTMSWDYHDRRYFCFCLWGMSLMFSARNHRRHPRFWNPRQLPIWGSLRWALWGFIGCKADVLLFWSLFVSWFLMTCRFRYGFGCGLRLPFPFTKQMISSYNHTWEGFSLS